MKYVGLVLLGILFIVADCNRPDAFDAEENFEL